MQVSERLCSTCKETKDEIHFIFKCALFDSTRKQLIQEIIEIDQTFSLLNGGNYLLNL